MNNDDAILAELKKISAWSEQQRKMSRLATIMVAIAIPLVIVLGIVADYDVKSTIARVDAPTWYDVDRDARAGDFDKALQVGEDLMKKAPWDPDAHRRLGNVYLAAGKTEKAKEQYEITCLLFPSEENQKLREAIVKRIASDQAKSQTSPSAPQ